MNGLFDEIRIAVHSVWQRRWIALATAWAICLLGWLVVALIPNTYESKARILVQMQGVLADKVGISSGDRARQIDEVEQTLTSAINLEKVVRATDLGTQISSPREMEAAVESLRKNIKVVASQDNLFEITASANESGYSDAANAKLAQRVVQKMIDIFREENLAGGRGEMSETLAFLDAQLEQRQRQLEEAEQRRLEFETRNAGLLPGVGSVSSRVEGARLELRQVEADLMSAQSSLAAINGQLAGTPPTISSPYYVPGAGGGGGGGARAALSQAQSELASARARGWTDSHPDVVAMKAQIASLRAAAAAEPAGGGGGGMRESRSANPAYSSLQSIRAERQANVAALMARKAALQGELAAMGAKQAEEPGVAAEAARINRDYEVLKGQYDKLLQDREELKLRGQVESETSAIRFEVIDPPSSPRTPVAPNRPLLLVGVLLAGIGGGIGLAFALGQLRGSFVTIAKLQKATGLPVLGSVSHTLTAAQRAMRKKQLRWLAGGIAGLFGVFTLLMAVEFVQRGMVA